MRVQNRLKAARKTGRRSPSPSRRVTLPLHFTPPWSPILTHARRKPAPMTLLALSYLGSGRVRAVVFLVHHMS